MEFFPKKNSLPKIVAILYCIVLYGLGLSFPYDQYRVYNMAFSVLQTILTLMVLFIWWVCLFRPLLGLFSMWYWSVTIDFHYLRRELYLLFEVSLIFYLFFT